MIMDHLDVADTQGGVVRSMKLFGKMIDWAFVALWIAWMGVTAAAFVLVFIGWVGGMLHAV